MHGEVIRLDEGAEPGFIRGDDGNLYCYTRERVHKRATLSVGTRVDFIALGEDARDIYLLHAPAAASAGSSGVPAVPLAPAEASRSDGMFVYFLRALSRNYFQFYGRARRREYWGFLLFALLSLIVLFFADIVLSAMFYGENESGEPNFWPVLSGLFYLYCIFPSLSVTVRRLHDQDMSGWLLLLNFVPYIGGIILFILMFFDSRAQPNKHGISPKYAAAQTVHVFT